MVEEIAYTWFNRFIALRYMEVNNYLPQKVRIFTNENNEFKPEILTEAIHLDLDKLDKQKVFGYIQNNNQEDLYKYLLLTICNDMNKYLPDDMFTSIKDYKALLLPDNLLKEDSVLDRLIKDIDEGSFKDQVQIIGWMYQYYIQMPKDELIHAKKQYKTDDVPFVTQLFTPDWIVRYLVENTLGNYYIRKNPDTNLSNDWNYFMKNNSLENSLQKIENIKFIDPCIGSGHILVYAFDLLMSFYMENGYAPKDAAEVILKNNLYGFDIDERAYQLAYFSLMMKARQYNRRILSSKIKPNIYCINNIEIDSGLYEYLIFNNSECEIALSKFKTLFTNAKIYGSLLDADTLSNQEIEDLENSFNNIINNPNANLEEMLFQLDIQNKLLPSLQIVKLLKLKYDFVVTNPPYLSSSLMPNELKKFIQLNYKDVKSDLFAVFIKKCIQLSNTKGYIGMLTPYVWMFISSYESLRHYVLQNTNISGLIQLEYNAFEAACVPVVTFIMHNTLERYNGNYIKLSDFKGADNQAPKTIEAINNHDCGFYYETSTENFSKIPGSPIAYWLSEIWYKIFEKGIPLGDFAFPKQGLATADNNKYLRLWFEPNILHILLNSNSREQSLNSNAKWFPHCKGGVFRKWYGNRDYIIDWQNDGKELLAFKKAVIRNSDFYFEEGMSYSDVSSGTYSLRYYGTGFIFDSTGPMIFMNKSDKFNKFDVISFLNSSVVNSILKILCPTIHYTQSSVAKIPLYDFSCSRNIIEKLTTCNIALSKHDWDSFETSWDFTAHPLVKNHANTIRKAYSLWDKECNDRFNQLKANEEELNRIFVDIYGLQYELDPYVEDKDVTVRKADLVRDIKSFISYAVGCMFGRYSLDKEGLVFAGGSFDGTYWKYRGEAPLNLDGSLPSGDAYAGVSIAKLHYAAIRDNDDYIKATKLKYEPDIDDIIPICEEEYFKDDVVSRFVEFVKCAYGEETLEENLQFISNALGGKGAPRDVLRNYFLNDFFKDHCNTYQVTGSGKRPIYWQFDSGKKNGFKALVYIHRYTPDLIARMRTGYIHPLQSQYRTQIDMLNSQIEEAASTSEKVKLQKQLKKITEQSQELGKYEEKIHHWADKMEPMDLDDGVKVNYAKFQDLLAKVK